MDPRGDPTAVSRVNSEQNLTWLTRASCLEALTIVGFPPSDDQATIIMRGLPSLRRLAFGYYAIRDHTSLARWLGGSPAALAQLTSFSMPSPTVDAPTLALLIDACPRMERFGPVALTTDACLLQMRRWSNLQFVDLNLWSAQASTRLSQAASSHSESLTSTEVAQDNSVAGAMEVIVRNWPEVMDAVPRWHTFLDGRCCLPRPVTSLHLSNGNLLSVPTRGLFAVSNLTNPFRHLTTLTLELPFVIEYGDDFEALGRAAPQLRQLILRDCNNIKCTEVKRLASNGGGAALESLEYHASYFVPARVLADEVTSRDRVPNYWPVAERAAFEPPSNLFPALRKFVYEEMAMQDPFGSDDE